uniref:Uncharacterized protein n=1 Tax=Steinernema glaseri TaxID=37863 RepID=A0A1I8A9H7_9BILA
MIAKVHLGAAQNQMTDPNQGPVKKEEDDEIEEIPVPGPSANPQPYLDYLEGHLRGRSREVINMAERQMLLALQNLLAKYREERGPRH